MSTFAPIMNIPFSPPYIDNSVVEEVTDSLRSGWITTGPKVKALEEEIMKLAGSEAVLCVNSWTTGAIMALRWLGVKADDEVIIPAYTYCATALAVIWAGAKPVMVDAGEDFNISVEAIRRAITPRTKAILPVDIAGWPCDYKAIMQLVQEPDIVKKICMLGETVKIYYSNPNLIKCETTNMTEVLSVVEVSNNGGSSK